MIARRCGYKCAQILFARNLRKYLGPSSIFCNQEGKVSNSWIRLSWLIVTLLFCHSFTQILCFLFRLLITPLLSRARTLKIDAMSLKNMLLIPFPTSNSSSERNYTKCMGYVIGQRKVAYSFVAQFVWQCMGPLTFESSNWQVRWCIWNTEAYSKARWKGNDHRWQDLVDNATYTLLGLGSWRTRSLDQEELRRRLGAKTNIEL